VKPVDALLLLALPYASALIFAVGMAWRHRRAPFTVSALSSQFLEARGVRWGAVPFHLGIAILFVGHLLPFLFPAAWRDLVSRRPALLTVETVGIAAALLTMAGLLLLLGRRFASPSVRAVTSRADLLVLVLLVAQVGLGLAVALLHRWGAVWSVGTTTPYLWSLVTLRPDATLVAGLPLLAKLHLTGAWVVLALVPFTRLVHLFSVPLGYLTRPYQRVVWSRRRRTA
jgi:nitrate reductase gamma subunit